MKGLVRQSFDFWIGTNARFSCEWRDSTAYPANVGPSVLFDGSGRVTVDGKSLTEIPAAWWVHVEIEASLGKNALRTFKLTRKPAQAARQQFRELPISGAAFHELDWLGFSSTAKANAVFYLDSLSFARVTK
jgi:hypothetical protein